MYIMFDISYSYFTNVRFRSIGLQIPVTAFPLRSVQQLTTVIQSRPEHHGYSLPDMQQE